MRYRVILLVMAVVTACGDDGSGPEGAEIRGVWIYTATSLSASDVSCNIADVEATINQTGSTFTGSTNGGVIFCTADGETVADDFPDVPILNGTISGTNVSFDLESADFHHVGTVTSNAMAGAVTLRIDLGDPIGVVVLEGDWSAARQ